MRLASLRLSQSASAIALLIASSAPVYAAAPALPTGGTVVAGNATIGASTSGNVTITQTSAKAVINWNSFNVAAGDSVVFVQPDANSATLSRVTGTTASTIAGEIDATGSVFLINPNGIAITKTGVVNVGRGFVASSADIADSDFMAGKGNFAATAGAVSNAGKIITQTGGYVGLLGGDVSNTGTILAPAGQVVVGAGTTATLDVNGGGFLQVALPKGATVSPMGNAALVSGAQANSAVRNVVNLPASVNAQSATGTSGNVYLGGTISVDSASGDAGHIKVLGNTTTVAGTLSAQATGASGNGGFIETSGNQVAFVKPSINTSAAHGKTGTWLVDPTDLTIDAAAAATIDAALGFTNVELDTYFDGSTSGPGNTSPGLGDINVQSDLAWNSGNTLTLNAYNNINISAQITAATGGLTLTAGVGNAAPGAGLITDTADLSVGTFRLTNGNWVQNGSLPAFSATDFGFDPQNASFLRVSGGDGSSGNPYQIADVYGLQGMASQSLLSDNFVLANSIDASGTAGWNGGAGFVSIGTDGNGTTLNSSQGFTGSLQGQGNQIDGLTVNRGSANYVGLFGSIGAGGLINNVGLTNANITGSDFVGGLAGLTTSANITNSYVSGTVSGDTFVGGLVGDNHLTAINNAESLATVTGFDAVGGLVGLNTGTINIADAVGTVSGNADVGGLVGLNSGGTITTAYATGSVSGNAAVGGLVGLNTGSIDTAYATGTVTATGLNPGSIGGLVGYNAGAISNAYATGEIDASLTSNVGGLVGYNDTSGTITDTYATGLINGTGNGNAAGLVGANGGAVTDSYWDSYASGQSSGIGADFGTTTNLAAVTSDPGQTGAANYITTLGAWSNFNNEANSGIDNLGGTTNAWRIYDGYTAPLLRAFLSPLTVTANSDTATYDRTLHSVTGYTTNYAPNPGLLLGTAVDVGGSGTNAATYGHSISGLYSHQQGYDITLVAGSLLINPAALTITADSGLTSIYGNAIVPLTYSESGLYLGDSITGALATTASPTANVGNYAITQGTLTAGGNYTITYTGANYAITARTLNVTATSGLSSIYGNAVGPFTYAVGATDANTGLVNGNGLSGSLTSAASPTANVGLYAITQGSLTAGGNYNLVYTGANYSITARSLFVSATTGLSSVYGSAIAPLTYTVGGLTPTSGLVNGDTLSGALATGATSHSNVGTYAVRQGTLSAGSNYNLSYTGAAYNITPAALTVTYTANAASSIYGNTPTGLSGNAAVTGLVNGDLAGGVTAGSASWATTATGLSNVGNYAITGSGITLNSGNYTLNSVQAAGNATALSITPRTVLITPTGGQTSVYGMPLAPTYAVGGVTSTTGLVNGNTLSGVLGLNSPKAIPDVGSYNITLGTLTGGSNYSLSLTNVAVPYVITAARITVTATSGTSVYGTSPVNPGLTVTGMGAGSLVTNQMAATQLTGLTNSFGITGTTNVTGSPYVLTVNGTLTNPNYIINQRVNGTWVVTPASVIVSYNATPVTRPYFSANPVVTGTVSATGLVNGATLSTVTTGTATWSTTATQTSNAGFYAITGAGLSVKANANYTTTIVQNGANATAFHITPLNATVTYTANTASRIYGNANPAFSGTVAVTGLVNGGTLANTTTGSAIFTSVATTATGVGKYAINGSGISGNSVNYIFNFVQAAGNATALTISPRALTLTANNLSRLYGAANPTSDTVTAAAATATTGLVNGDTVTSETVTTNALINSGVGTYALNGSNAVFGTGSAANYTITYAVNQFGLTITPAPLTLTYTANAVSRIYGTSNPTFTGTVSATGLVAGDTLGTATLGGTNWTS